MAGEKAGKARRLEGLASLPPPSLPRWVDSPRLSSATARGRNGEGGAEGRVVTKPIIFTCGLLPASRRVILNGFSDPSAGSEPWESPGPQMRL